ncbi:Probable CtpA-like serine protease [uncultured Ruminococcus sp.]|uniref:S41 family peptidase n=1 Tax=Massiliimalia timonensis TaxID=1987501 RepID=A0A8J6TX56_9FIRM|nr:S41 family peptidase [Massiliimalia timonensis]MBC8610660.1 S41 family peptidase [Massiliimalia timonensis]SCH93570.1 Probable CtpA-like serine protease [uncultured Clostridium sp.]SCI26196.1 Probable CtpA-like serine protease [uncultured Ruminococcus sp.]
MNKKISLGAAIAFMAVVASITFVITMLFSQGVFNKMISNVSQRESMYEKIQEIDKLVRNNYLFELDEDALKDEMASGLINGLEDPYAAYLDQEEYERDLLESKGELVGIGIQASVDPTNGYMTVVSIYDGAPAAESGLQVGDIIVKIDGKDVAEVGATEAIKMISGEPGTKVTVTVRRDAVDTDYTLQRKQVEIPSIVSRMIDTNCYIKITEFNANTPEQFKKAIETAQKNGAKGLIFDLRGNGGGNMDAVTEMLDYLLPSGNIVTQTDAKGETTVLATSDDSQVSMPMITLTNGKTASASELFVADLKDYGKAQSVGTTTYGKGVMQTTYALSDGSAIRLTTGYFNPAKSDNFNGVGIAPDYEVTLTAEQEQNFATLDETTDPQLKKAIEVINSQVQ